MRALIMDYGGVLTTSSRAGVTAWCRTEGIDHATYRAAMRAWLTPSAPDDSPIRLLETSRLAVPDFEKALAAELRTTDGGAVDPDGLLHRMFADSRPDTAMENMVRTAHDRGVRTALLSNSWGGDYPHHRWTGLFDVTVISGTEGVRKPDAEIYRRTLDRLGIPATDAVFVDDAPPNITAAHDLGIHAVLHADDTPTTITAVTHALRTADR